MFSFNHFNFNVVDLERSLAFYKEALGLEPVRTEGYSEANWIILDYTDIMVHVFNKETRDFYKLEKLWQDGEFMDVSEYVKEG